MALILAIEPDRRQANQLNALVRGRLHADLVLAETAERALAALGDRVPDLILTSALLSPTDEHVLGERLRALDGTAAHVQTLTIPVLATAHAAGQESSGMLAALRRGRKAAAPDGCDPAVFAAQCAEYLERAKSERAAQAAVEPVRMVAPPPAPSALAHSVSSVSEAPATPQAPLAPQARQGRQAPMAPLATQVRVNAAAAQLRLQEAIAALEATAPPPAPAADNFVELDLSPMLDDGKREEPATVAARAVEEEEPAPDVYDISVDDMNVDEAIAESTPLAAGSAWQSVDMAAAAAVPEPPRMTLTPPSPRRQRPVRDEWGFFDPNQCGFNALLEKLDELIVKGTDDLQA